MAGVGWSLAGAGPSVGGAGETPVDAGRSLTAAGRIGFDEEDWTLETRSPYTRLEVDNAAQGSSSPPGGRGSRGGAQEIAQVITGSPTPQLAVARAVGFAGLEQAAMLF